MNQEGLRVARAYAAQALTEDELRTLSRHPDPAWASVALAELKRRSDNAARAVAEKIEPQEKA